LVYFESFSGEIEREEKKKERKYRKITNKRYVREGERKRERERKRASRGLL